MLIEIHAYTGCQPISNESLINIANRRWGIMFASMCTSCEFSPLSAHSSALAGLLMFRDFMQSQWRQVEVQHTDEATEATEAFCRVAVQMPPVSRYAATASLVTISIWHFDVHEALPDNVGALAILGNLFLRLIFHGSQYNSRGSTTCYTVYLRAPRPFLRAW